MTPVTPEDAQRKFEATEQCFRDTEADIKASREFITKNKEALAQIPADWRLYGWSGRELTIGLRFTQEPAKEIARLFGSDGWKRKPNPHTCGAINWVKEFDGFKLIIEHAENVESRLIEEVKI